MNFSFLFFLVPFGIVNLPESGGCEEGEGVGRASKE